MGLKELTGRVVDALNLAAAETAQAQQLVEQYQEEVTKAKGQFYNDSKPSKFLVGQIILESDPRLQVEILRAIVTTRFPRYGSPLLLLRAQLLNRRLPLFPKLIDALLAQAIESNVYGVSWDVVLKNVEIFAKNGGEIAPYRAGLEILRSQCSRYTMSKQHRVVMQVDELLGDAAAVGPDPGAPWADRALSELAAMPLDAQSVCD